MKDPYTSLLQIMQGEGSKNNPSTVVLGTILNVSPLRLKVGDLQLTKDNLLVNPDIKELNKNDLVATISINSEQTYVVLCRVV